MFFDSYENFFRIYLKSFLNYTKKLEDSVDNGKVIGNYTFKSTSQKYKTGGLNMSMEKLTYYFLS